MSLIYDVIAKRHGGNSKPDCVLFYDEDREKSINYINEYVKKNGFSIYEKDGRFTIADIVLRERTGTGEKIREIPYRSLFDIYGKRLVN